MSTAFITELVSNYLSTIGVCSDDIIEQVIVDCSIRAEVQTAMSDISTRIICYERLVEEEIGSTRDAEMLTNHRRRHGAYMAICNDHFEYMYARVWIFRETACPSLPGWFYDILADVARTFQFENILARCTNNQLQIALDTHDEDARYAMNIQVLAWMFVQSYENGIMVGYH